MGDLNDIKKKRKIGNLDSPKMPFDYNNREYGTVPRDINRAPFQWVSEVAYKNTYLLGNNTCFLSDECFFYTLAMPLHTHMPCVYAF